MFLINICTYFVNVDIFRYLMVAFAFYGTFLCLRLAIFK